MSDVDPSHATFPLAAFCFMTGFMYATIFSVLGPSLVRPWSLDLTTAFDHSGAISFSAIFVWCGFQTGNFVQVSHPHSSYLI